MAAFELQSQYDVILCLFSSIGYLQTIERVRRALVGFRSHLNPDGIVLIEPWFPPGALVEGRVSVKTVQTPSVSICRMSVPEISDGLSYLRFHYLVGRTGTIEHIHETHTLGLFTTEELLRCFADAKLDATFDPSGPYGRGLFIARAA
jgi:hypothetical protein